MLREIILNKGLLNDYQMGRINGIACTMADALDRSYPWRTDSIYQSEWVMTIDTSDEQLGNILNTIDRLYPGAITEII